MTAPSRNSVGYQRLLAAVEAANPAGTIVVVTDNLSSHTSVSTRTWLAGKGFATKQPPPALLQTQPAGPLGDEGVLDAGMAGQPGPGRIAGVAGVMTMMVPAGLAASTAASSRWSPTELPEGRSSSPRGRHRRGARRTPRSSPARGRSQVGLSPGDRRRSSRALVGSCAGSPGRARRHRSPTSPPAGRYSRR